MEDAMKTLAGVWSGRSENSGGRRGSPTLWKDTVLVFRKNGESVNISGQGFSEWKGKVIDFTLSG